MIWTTNQPTGNEPSEQWRGVWIIDTNDPTVETFYRMSGGEVVSKALSDDTRLWLDLTEGLNNVQRSHSDAGVQRLKDSLLALEALEMTTGVEAGVTATVNESCTLLADLKKVTQGCKKHRQHFEKQLQAIESDPLDMAALVEKFGL